jgi:O-antigen ligase
VTDPTGNGGHGVRPRFTQRRGGDVTVLARGGLPIGRPGWATVGGLGAAVLGGLLIGVAGPLLLMGVVAVVVVLAAIVWAPGVLLAAYLLIPNYKAAVQPYSPIDITLLLALANAAQLGALVLASWPRSTSATERIPIVRQVSIVGVGLWLALGLLVVGGVLYSPDQSTALGKAVDYAALVILAILPAAIRVGGNPRYVAQFVWTFLAMGIITVVLGVTAFSSNNRLTVLDVNTIQVGRAALLVPLLAATLVIPSRRRWLTFLVLVMVPLSLIVAVSSGSRGPLLMLVAVGVIAIARYVIVDRSRAWRLMIGAAALVIVSALVLSIAAPILPASALDRYQSLAEFLQGGLSTSVIPAAGGETSAYARVIFAQFALGMFADHPLIGVGTGGFQILFQSVYGPDAAAWPHNAFLQVGSEHGLLGLVVFAGVILFALTRRLPGLAQYTTLRVLTLFYVLNAMVSGDIFTDRETLGLLLLLLVVSVQAVTTTAEEASEREPAAIGGGRRRWISSPGGAPSTG